MKVTDDTFKPAPNAGQRNVTLTITVEGAPDGFPQSGEAELVAGAGSTEPGRFTREESTVKAVFDLQREWHAVSYSALRLSVADLAPIELAFPESDARGRLRARSTSGLPLVTVSPIRPRELRLERSADETELLAKVATPPNAGALGLCRSRSVYLMRDSATLAEGTVEPGAMRRPQNGALEVPLRLVWPGGRQPDLHAVLELCDAGRGRWVFRGRVPASVVAVETPAAAESPQGASVGPAPGATPPPRPGSAPGPGVTGNGDKDEDGFRLWPVRRWEWIGPAAGTFFGVSTVLLFLLLTGTIRFGGGPDRASLSGARPLTESSLPPAWSAGISSAVTKGLGELPDLLASLRKLIEEAPRHGVKVSAAPEPATANAPQILAAVARPTVSADQALLDVVNAWWARGASRPELEELIRRSGHSLGVYRSVDVSGTLQRWTNRTFSFQPSSGPPEWLCYAEGPTGDLLAVPGDPGLFLTADILKFVASMFSGLGTSLRDVRFRRVLKAARLRPVGDGRYVLVERGALELAERSGGQPGKGAADVVFLAESLPESEAPLATGPRIEDFEATLERRIRDHEAWLSASLDDVVRALGQRQQAAPPERTLADLPGAVARSLATLRAELLERIDTLAVRNPASAPTFPIAAEPLRDEAGERPAERAVAGVREDAERGGPGLEGEMAGAEVSDPDPAEPIESARVLAARLAPWLPDLSVEGAASGGPAEPAAYLQRLLAAKRVIEEAAADRGWRVAVVHVDSLPGAASGRSLSLHDIQAVSPDMRQIDCRCGPFTDAYLYQFALGISEDGSQLKAVVPPPGVAVDRHREAYERLAGGRLPAAAVRLDRVVEPAILRRQRTGDFLYEVVRPLKAEFSS